MIQPFSVIFAMYTAVSHILRGLTSALGLAYLILQISLFPFVRLKKDALDRVLTRVESADLVVAVGGNYLYSNRSLFNHLLILFYAKFVKKRRVLLLGHSIGPFRDKVGALIAKYLLIHVDAVVFREELSYKYIISNISKDINALVSGDLAFLLPSPSRIEPDQVPSIGVSLRKWFHRDPRLFRKYLNAMKGTVMDIVEEGHWVYLMPFSYLDGAEDDVTVCRSFLMEIPDELRNRVELVDLRELSPNEITAMMCKLNIRIFIATRLHSAILASLSNIPSVIISYQHFKAHGISAQLGLNEYVIRIDEADRNDVYEKFINLYKDLDESKKILAESVEDTKSKIYTSSSGIIRKMIYGIYAAEEQLT